ncbi:MAG: M28 family peptidase [Elusimicrobia bacterium]|nr:M28 family peptidase [Elusimicrobiota bacterium]
MSLRRVLGLTLGAAALLLLAAWLLMTQPSLPGGRPATSAPGADAARLEADVRVLSTRLLPRDFEHPAGLDRAAAYIKGRLAEAGGKVSEQVYTFTEWDRRNRKVERGPYRNVIASFGPDTEELLVVGAHYDAYGSLPGADDNASGVAGLLELARLLGGRPPALRTELVAFTLEEPPQFGGADMGSARYAAALKSRGARLRAMLALEMIGRFSDQPGSQRYPLPLLRLFYPGRGDFAAVVGRGELNRAVKRAMRSASGLPVVSLAAPASLPGVDYSDHSSFWAQGYPAVMITDTAFYRNPDYHTSQDTADRLDYRRMAQVVDGVSTAVLELAR